MLNRLLTLAVLLSLAPGLVLAQSDYCDRLAEERLKPTLEKVDKDLEELARKVEAYRKVHEEYVRRQRSSGCYAFGELNEELRGLCYELLSEQAYYLNGYTRDIRILSARIDFSLEGVSNAWDAAGCDTVESSPPEPAPPVEDPPPGSDGSGTADEQESCHRDWQQHEHPGYPGTKYWHRHVGGECRIASARNP